MLTSLFQSKNIRFFGKYKLKVEQAVEPTNIMWENQDISPSETSKRRMVTKLITAFIILLSVCFILASHMAKGALTQTEKCPERTETYITNTANHTEMAITIPI